MPIATGPGDRRGYTERQVSHVRRPDSRYMRNASPVPEGSGHHRRYSPYKQHTAVMSSRLEQLHKGFPPSMTTLQRTFFFPHPISDHFS